MYPPERIVCLTEETTETLYLLGEQDRIVGVSGYTVRPPQARREKPRVSAFISADIPKILALQPDLVLTFSDLQADIVASLIRAGVAVHAFNQRTVAEILGMIRTLGALVGVQDRADGLANRLASNLEDTRKRAAQRGNRPKVYFEEWDEPMISGIAWVSELIDAAGGADVFPELAACKSATGEDRNGRRGDPPVARHHHRLLVRQEIQKREGRGAAGLRDHPGHQARATSRDQVTPDPAAGTGSAHRRTRRSGSDNLISKRDIREPEENP